MATLSAAMLLPRGRRPNLMLSPETDVVCSTSTATSSHKKMRFRRRRSSSSKKSHEESGQEQPATLSLSSKLPEVLPPLFSTKKSKSRSKSKTTSEVLQWMEASCPHDVLPKILAFCGPQTTAKLHRCSRFWHSLISSEETWRVLCEELYKWNEGEPEPECSWREFYAQNPCVPIDYATVPQALKAISPSHKEADDVVAKEAEEEEDTLPCRTIWLRPQDHRVSETILMEASHANITLESMTTTTTNYYSKGRKSRRQKQPLAALVFQTRRRNKPLLHIAAGHVTLKNLRLGHYCGGFNLWCGNSCVQVQPLTPPTREAMGLAATTSSATPLPTATVQACEIVSHSGRGIVVNDGGDSLISHSYIHDCAATGIYVGSDDCHLTLEHSDLIANGHGNQLAASVRASTGGVTRGHSGFYLENGNATIRECNISNNSSCGITVSSTNSELVLDHSDVVANGHSSQVEVAFGSRQVGAHNTVAKTGLVKVRSRLGFESCIGKNNGNRKRNNSVSSHGSNNSSSGATSAATSSEAHYILTDEEEEEEADDDLEHLQGSFVVAQEDVRFGELIEI